MSTIVANTKFTLNGVANFKVGTDVYHWDNHWLGYVDVWAGKPGQNLTATVALTGSNWHMSTLRFSGNAKLKVFINDAGAGTNRSMEYLLLNGLAGSKVTLTNTQIDFIRGGKGVDD